MESFYLNRTVTGIPIFNNFYNKIDYLDDVNKFLMKKKIDYTFNTLHSLKNRQNKF